MNVRLSSILLTTLTLAGATLCQAPAIERVQPDQDLTWKVTEPMDVVLVFASWRNLTVPFGAYALLADATMIKCVAALDADDQVHVDLPAGLDQLLATSDLYVQAIGLKTKPVLSIQPAAVEMVIAKPCAADQAAGWSKDETEALFASNLEWLSVSHLIHDPKASTFGLYAEFLGRSNGYGLKSAGHKVVDGRAQVYLELKVPGSGEGDVAVVQMHQLMLDLGKDGRWMDVHVAITDGSRHTAYRPFGSFGLK
jgi:hypothetical protein